MIRYVDTSVHAKAIVDDLDSDSVMSALDGYRRAGDELVSSAILTTELHIVRSTRLTLPLRSKSALTHS